MARPTVKVTGQQGQWWVNAGPLGRLPTAHIYYLKREWYEYRHSLSEVDGVLRYRVVFAERVDVKK